MVQESLQLGKFTFCRYKDTLYVSPLVLPMLLAFYVFILCVASSFVDIVDKLINGLNYEFYYLFILSTEF